MSEKIFDKVNPGVVTGDDVQEIFRIAKENNFAIPAVNVVGTNTINANYLMVAQHFTQEKLSLIITNKLQ